MKLIPLNAFDDNPLIETPIIMMLIYFEGNCAASPKADPWNIPQNHPKISRST